MQAQTDEEPERRPRTRLCAFYRLRIRYSDGQTATFVPESGLKFFAQDHAKPLVWVLEEASSKTE